MDIGIHIQIHVYVCVLWDCLKLTDVIRTARPVKTRISHFRLTRFPLTGIYVQSQSKETKRTIPSVTGVFKEHRFGVQSHFKEPDRQRHSKAQCRDLADRRQLLFA